MNELALFAGAGGGILGGTLLGWRTVCAVEIEPYPASILLQRQNDGILPPFPIWDDVRTFDGKPWCGIVDVISGGFPCQDISAAGRRAGITGERSGLWKEFARIISEVRPKHVLVENSPALTIRGGVRVVGDLAELGYDCRWGVIGANSLGGPVERKRLWIACTDKKHGEKRMGNIKKTALFEEVRGECPSFWLQAPPVSFGMEHGIDSYLDQVSAIGNGQVPAVVKIAWEILTRRT
jgi:DNA (cytosine-5)-methyltransferase 1